jgi:hypothetical protein
MIDPAIPDDPVEKCRCEHCPDCMGRGYIQVPTESYPEWDEETCEMCDGSGISETCEFCEWRDELIDMAGRTNR